jgi:uncharacterized protein YjbI with pentapeptide repeats
LISDGLGSTEVVDMDRDEALKLLTGGKAGITYWNKWREQGEELPDLADADLSSARLVTAKLDHADLSWVHLSPADLSAALLKDADLIGANLSGMNLSRANFTGTNLSSARLVSAKLDHADLTGAYLIEANLNGANLSWANLSSAFLNRANLTGATLSWANLSSARLGSAKLDHADLSSANLIGADLAFANLTGANLSGARLKDADLIGANLSGVDLAFADLSGADFRINKSSWIEDVRQLRFSPVHFDGNRIKDARLPPWLREAWSILRRTYTGPKFAFLLLFTSLAFLPYVGQVLFWLTLNRVERQVYPLGVAAIRRAVGALRESNDGSVVAWVQNAAKFLDENDRRHEQGKPPGGKSLVSMREVKRMTTLLNQGVQALKSVDDTGRLPRNLSELRDSRYWMDLALISVQPMIPEGKLPAKERRIWQLLLGTDRGIGGILLTTTLLLYNALRGFLTYCLGPLRDEEERTSETPFWDDYWLLWRTHQVISVLLYISLISGLMQIWEILFTTVLVAG